MVRRLKLPTVVSMIADEPGAVRMDPRVRVRQENYRNPGRRSYLVRACADDTKRLPVPKPYVAPAQPVEPGTYLVPTKAEPRDPAAPRTVVTPKTKWGPAKEHTPARCVKCRGAGWIHAQPCTACEGKGFRRGAIVAAGVIGK